MKVLIIDNNIDPSCWGAKDLARFSKLTPHASFYVRRGPQADLPHDPSRFDRIIVSGSRASVLSPEPWIDELQRFLKKAYDRKQPILGVCYGHQVLAHMLGGSGVVRKAQRAEFGWTEVEVLHPSPLFEGLPERFHTFSAHYDEVTDLPQGLVHIARSNHCDIQAFQAEDRPVYGIQFHPERTLEGAQLTIAEQTKKGELEQILNAKHGQKLYDPEIGNRIFGNFLK